MDIKTNLDALKNQHAQVSIFVDYWHIYYFISFLLVFFGLLGDLNMIPDFKIRITDFWFQ